MISFIIIILFGKCKTKIKITLLIKKFNKKLVMNLLIILKNKNSNLIYNKIMKIKNNFIQIIKSTLAQVFFKNNL